MSLDRACNMVTATQAIFQEAESYVAKYRMEHERVRELDQLVAYFRTQEHQLQIEIKVLVIHSFDT